MSGDDALFVCAAGWAFFFTDAGFAVWVRRGPLIFSCAIPFSLSLVFVGGAFFPERECVYVVFIAQTEKVDNKPSTTYDDLNNFVKSSSSPGIDDRGNR